MLPHTRSNSIDKPKSSFKIQKISAKKEKAQIENAAKNWIESTQCGCPQGSLEVPARVQSNVQPSQWQWDICTKRPWCKNLNSPTPTLSQYYVIFLVLNGYCWNCDVFERRGINESWVQERIAAPLTLITLLRFCWLVILVWERVAFCSALSPTVSSFLAIFLPPLVCWVVLIHSVCVCVILMFDSWNFWNCLYI